MTKKPKLISSIRAKLVSAVAMLLVAMIMVVSSTYAWFTLSTAPEVTGISTQIGANGALEMALLPLNGVDEISSSVGDGALSALEKNITWGNLVNLSEGYGLDKITLYPSTLNISDGKINSFPLGIPVYGADGRVESLNFAKTLTGVYDNGYFYQDNNFGVRGVGAASGMTERQLNFRDARAQGATATEEAKKLASTALNTKGSALANIAIEHGMGGTESYNKTDVEALRYLIDETKKSLAAIEKAYMYYIAAYAASAEAQENVTDIQAKAIYDTVTAEGATLAGVMGILADNGVSALPTEVSNAITKLNATSTQVTAADNALKTLETDLTSNEAATFTWDQISGAMTPMASTSAMKINGFAASEVKENLGELVSSVTANGGLTVSMATGAGVFADIADHCGDYTASVTIERVEYNGIVLNNMKARMATATTVNPQYLSATGTYLDRAGSPAGTGAVLPFSEFYGYIIDMAFRTNAAESNLLLQTEGIDRIYGEDNANEATMGHGSTMAFSSDDTNFSNDQIKNLMSSLRVVFFTPNIADTSNTGTVLAYAKLDMAHAIINGNSEVEAPLVLYKVTTTTTTTYKTDASGNYLAEDDSVLYYYNSADQKFYDGSDFSTATVVEEANMVGRVVVNTTTSETETMLTGDDAVITAMVQNAVVKVSALVYLDGEGVGNDDVSATVAKSMTGKMNLQFSSSANLVPMEYADLHTPKAPAEGGEQTP